MGERDALRPPGQPEEPQWVKIQEETFRQWFNHRLGVHREGYSGRRADNLCTDLSDGTLLIQLLQQLTGTAVASYTASPRNEWQKNENIAKAFKFMAEEGLDLVSIDAEHIRRGERKLVLGLVWHLILHYQLNKWGTLGIVQLTQALLDNWKFVNLSSDWRDGRLLMALINLLVAESTPNAVFMSTSNAEKNCREALSAAEKHLRIPQIISSDVMRNLGRSDEMAMCFLTYLSYYINPIRSVLLSWVNNTLPSLPIHNFSADWCSGVAFLALMEACKPGSCPDWEALNVGDKAGNIDRVLAVGMDKLGLTVDGSGLGEEECRESKVLTLVAKIKSCTRSKSQPSLEPQQVYGRVGECLHLCLPSVVEEETVQNLRAEVKVQGTGRVPEPHFICCKYNSESKEAFFEADFKNVGRYSVQVNPIQISCPSLCVPLADFDIKILDPDRCTITKIPPTISVGYTYHAKVSTTGGGPGKLISSVDPSEAISTVVRSREDECDQLDLELNGKIVGTATINFQWGPYTLQQEESHIIQVVDPSKCFFSFAKPETENQFRIGKPIDFQIVTRDSGGCKPTVRVTNVKNNAPCITYLKQDSTSKGLYTATFTPLEEGEYEISMLLDGVHVPKSPVRIHIQAISQSHSAKNESIDGGKSEGEQKGGEEQDGGEEGKQEELDEEGEELAEEEEEGKEKMEKEEENEDEEKEEEQKEEEEGEKEREDFKEKENASGSSSTIQDSTRASKCRVYGEVISQQKPLMVGRLVRFQVDSAEAGEGELKVSVEDSKSAQVQVSVCHNQRGGKSSVHSIQFKPLVVGAHTVHVKWNGVAIPGSPFQFQMINPSKVQVQDLPAGSNYVIVRPNPLIFKIDTSQAGEGDIRAISQLDNGETDEVELKTEPDGKITATYTPSKKGHMNLLLTFANIRVLQYPWSCDIVDPASITLIGSSLYTRIHHPYQVTVTGLSEHEVKYLTMEVVPPEGKSPLIRFNLNQDGTATILFTPELVGEFLVHGRLSEEPVQKSPLKVLVVSPSACRMIDPLPHHLAVGKEVSLRIDTTKAGPGSLTSTASHNAGSDESTPTENCIRVTSQDDLVKLKAIAPGKSFISLKWAGFDVFSEPNEISTANLNECSFRVLNIEDGGTVREEDDVTIDIDTSGANNCTPEVKLEDPQQKQVILATNQPTPGHHSVTIPASMCGTYTLDVSVVGVRVQGSPKSFTVLPKHPAVEVTGDLPASLQIRESATVQITTHTKGREPHVLCVPEGAFDVSVTKCTAHSTESSWPVEHVYWHDITITALKVGQHKFNFNINGNQLNEMLYSINVFDPMKCTLDTRPEERMQVGRITQLSIQTTGAGVEKLEVESSDSSVLQTSLEQIHADLHQLNLVPLRADNHPVTVELKYGGIRLPNFPLLIHSFDANEVEIEPSIISEAFLNQPIAITANTTNAGEGVLRVDTLDSNALKAEITQSTYGNHKHTVNCTPLMPGVHSLTIHWNDEEIPSSPVLITSCDPAQCVVSGIPPDQHPTLILGKSWKVRVDCHRAGMGVITAEILTCGESQTKTLPVQQQGYSAFFVVTPETIGETELSVKFNGYQFFTKKFYAKKAVCLWKRCPLSIHIAILVALTSIFLWCLYHYNQCSDCQEHSYPKPL